MIHLNALSNQELEERARRFAEEQLPVHNRLATLILALCDRLRHPNQDEKSRVVRILK